MSAAAASAGGKRSGLFLLPAATLWQREIVRFYRQRNRIIGALLSPLVFWFVIGSGIGPSFRVGSAPNGMAVAPDGIRMISKPGYCARSNSSVSAELITVTFGNGFGSW